MKKVWVQLGYFVLCSTLTLVTIALLVPQYTQTDWLTKYLIEGAVLVGLLSMIVSAACLFETLRRVIKSGPPE
jgi:hypothetical protein